MEIFWIIIICLIGPIIGSLLGILKKPSEHFIYLLFSFSGGVMLTISFYNLLPESIKLSSILVAGFGLVIGALLIMILDKIIPHCHIQKVGTGRQCLIQKASMLLLIGMFLHNFPEGMAMALGAVTSYKITLLIALNISLHDIPEGICTSAPYYFYSKKKLKSFFISAATALPTILGYLLAHTLFDNLAKPVVGFIIALTAGVMVYLSIDELLPTAYSGLSEKSKKTMIIAFVLGIMLVLINNFLIV